MAELEDYVPDPREKRKVAIRLIVSGDADVSRIVVEFQNGVCVVGKEIADRTKSGGKES
ncbi:hypothetical protein HY416_01665 [Candidatus Kaiserbacteria bacterium]|nr:hypothetical protein [Candidatus Kaiserbacteria bacterium]